MASHAVSDRREIFVDWEIAPKLEFVWKITSTITTNSCGMISMKNTSLGPTALWNENTSYVDYNDIFTWNKKACYE